MFNFFKQNQEIELDKSLTRINSILSRKDVVDVDNNRVDAIRMLAYYLEDREISAAQLVKFLKK